MSLPATDFAVTVGEIAAPLQMLYDKLAKFTAGEFWNILGVDDEVRKMQRSLEIVRAIAAIRREENRLVFSNRVTNQAWKLCLEDAEKTVYSADDLLDRISIDLSAAGGEKGEKAEKEVMSLVLTSLKLTLPREISELRKEVEVIAKEMELLHNIERADKSMKSGKVFSSYSCAMVGEGALIGRDREKDEVISLLLDDDSNHGTVSVFTIVGMGGVGKTALAQQVYQELQEHFVLKMWASASINSDIIDVMNSIIESGTGNESKLSNLDAVQRKLRKLIYGNSFILVLDDYWSEEYMDWEMLSATFKYAAKGSKVILCTRSRIVSKVIGIVGSYDLHCLSEDNCWEILKQTAKPDINFEDLGRKIAKKCSGLPLAAKIIGSMLRSMDDRAEWTRILESEMWEIEKMDVFPILALSYYHLPAHLKTCFTYCATFPKGHVFDINDLIHLWMAEGFIHTTGNRRLEDIGLEYFKSLVERCFFQQSKNDQGEDIYTMHDLMHSTAQLVSGNSSMCLTYDHQLSQDSVFYNNARHVSLNFVSVKPELVSRCLLYKNLRTFRVITNYIGDVEAPGDLFSKLKVVRVLSLRNAKLVELPNTIGDLKHLRYLNLSDNRFTVLPDAIAKLIGLQILNLDECILLATLPTPMKNMIGLRHLIMDTKLFQEITGIGTLVNLQSLPEFCVEREEGHRIVELKNLCLLRGCISIKKLENVANMDEAKGAMLNAKPFLHRLELEWSDIAVRTPDELTLAGLSPHENLKELAITNYSGHMWPSWFGSSKISSISLQNCASKDILIPLGTLQHLETLVIGSMSDWKTIDGYFSGFPLLESLAIRDIPNLTSWEDFDGFRFPKLRVLEIVNCPLLKNLPSFNNSLHYLTVKQCPKLNPLPMDGLPPSLMIITD